MSASDPFKRFKSQSSHLTDRQSQEPRAGQPVLRDVDAQGRALTLDELKSDLRSNEVALRAFHLRLDAGQPLSVQDRDRLLVLQRAMDELRSRIQAEERNARKTKEQDARRVDAGIPANSKEQVSEKTEKQKSSKEQEERLSQIDKEFAEADRWRAERAQHRGGRGHGGYGR